ncbi:MAG: hypothetical protein K2H37_03205 [Lachnospiraceae bacterium]|nr:hypothetical protein [Lachnospiraceae bacterium]
MELFIGRADDVGELHGYVKKNAFDGVEIWIKNVNEERCHYYENKQDKALYFVWGNFYSEEDSNPATEAAEAYDKSGEKSVFDIDGDFIFVKVSSKNDLIILQSNYAGMNLYYRQYDNRYTFCTDASVLLNDYCEEDIDERSVCDYLLYGSMVGGHTFSKRVKVLVRGQELVLSNNRICIENRHMIAFDSAYRDIGIDEAVDRLTDRYLRAVYKRSHGRVGKSAMFLSGGKDSRLLLSAFSNLYDDKIACISFGQFGADEVSNASVVASIRNNPHHVVNLNPEDYIKHAEEYIRTSIGMDWFPQSYALTVLKQGFEYTDIYPGSNITDICFHSKYTNDHIADFEGTLTEYMEEYHSDARMTGFQREILDGICKEDKLVDHLAEDTAKYKGRPEDIYVGYLNNTNGAYQICFRTCVFPGKFMDQFDVAGDKEFVKEICHLPIEYRLSDELHVRMIEKINSDYLRPVYNDYKIPMQCSKEDIRRAAEIEKQRAALYEKLMKKYNPVHKQKFYYPHDYADFNGFMKYDDAWKAYMDKLLLDKNAYIYIKLFDYNKVFQMLIEHRNSIKNWKKELILLASLEQFFRIFLL